MMRLPFHKVDQSRPTAETGYDCDADMRREGKLWTTTQEEDRITSKETFRKAVTFLCPRNTLWILTQKQRMNRPF